MIYLGTPVDQMPRRTGGQLVVLAAMVSLIEVDLAARMCRVVAGEISGFVESDGAIDEIVVLEGAAVIASATLGRPVPSLDPSAPVAGKIHKRRFRVSLNGCMFPVAETASFVVRARVADGELLICRLQLILPLQSATPFEFVPPIRVNLEQADLDNSGLLRVVGWAVALTPMVTVQISSEDGKIGSAEPTDVRHDVATAHPSYLNAHLSGFATDIRLSKAHAERIRRVTVQGFALDGSSQVMELRVMRLNAIFSPLPPKTLAAARTAPATGPKKHLISHPTPNIIFHCDNANLARNGDMVIDGWAASSAGVSRIAVSFDDKPVGDALLGRSRKDVGRAYPQMPHAAHSGFRFAGKVGAGAQGAHIVTLRFETPQGDSQTINMDIVAHDSGAQDGQIAMTEEDVILHVDDLIIMNGIAQRTITGRFNLNGWAISRGEIAEIQVEINGAAAGTAYYGTRRDDVKNAYPDWPGSLLSGFGLAIPGSLLKDGTSIFRIISRDKAGGHAETIFKVNVKLAAATSGPLVLRRKISHAEVLAGLRILEAASFLPVFALLVNINAAHAFESALKTLSSIAAQCYPDWQVTIALPAGESAEPWKARIEAALPRQVDKIFVAPRGNLSLFSHTFAPAGVIPPGGTLFAMLAPGDELACDTLLAVALANAARRQVDLLYGDDRRWSAAPRRAAPYFKPDWSPDLLLSQNYIGRCWFANAALIRRAGLTIEQMNTAGGYDTALRLTEAAESIHHLPLLLMEQARHGQDGHKSQQKALRAALKRRGERAVISPGCAPHIHRVQRAIIGKPLVSIIIPSIGAKDLIKTCIQSIHALTSYPAYEIIVLDNIRMRKMTAEQRAIKAWMRAHADAVIQVDEAFNWSRLNNIGANAATGNYLLFLNDDIEVVNPEWLTALLEHAQRPEVGVVGPLLLYPDGKIQHAGLFLSHNNIGTARHAFRFASPEDAGYFGLARSQRNVIAVTGACMLTSRQAFDAVGGFNEAHNITNNDVDFCLRIHRSGRRVIYTPHAWLTHHELATRAELADAYDAEHFRADWGDLCLAGDPFYNRNLTSDFDDMSFEDEPLREVTAGGPLGDPEEIRSILAVKLDHIGDMVTALPAIRRIKSRFPQARLVALVGRSAAGITRMEPAIDEVMEFDFFDARSSLGPKKLTRKDYAALEARLKPRKFDLALDLRKHADTRHVLQYCGARLLAGIDSAAQFPWLDYTDEWEGDHINLNKRNHIAADLINFVDGLANAFSLDRQTILPSAHPPSLSAALEVEFEALLESDYACIHPASGTPMRQWPPEYFAALIDLLVQSSGLKIAILGGPDEIGVARQVMETVKSTAGVYNLVGRSRMADLPALLARSVLFVGNNSGPQHIAAGLGVPTIGVHSGVIASEEWGPLGADAVAVRRDVACSPCYLSKPEHCRRALACVTTLSPHFVYESCQRLLLLRAGRAWSRNAVPEVVQSLYVNVEGRLEG